MTDKELFDSLENEAVQSHQNEVNQITEDLEQLHAQKKKERYLLSAIAAGIVVSMALGYNIWQKNALAQESYDYYTGGTPAAYTSSASGGAGGCCGGGGAPYGGTTNAATTLANPANGAYADPNAAGAGGCGSGGCGSSSAAGTTDPAQIEALARQYYQQNIGSDKGLEFKVQDFGCHTQIDIYKDGKLIKSLIYRGGQFSVY